MCEDCFNREYLSFKSEDIWLEFDLQLVEKLGRGEMKYLSNTDEGEYFYKCQNCNQKWRLKDPDYSFRGYFLRVQ
jgi:hypothetical protein